MGTKIGDNNKIKNSNFIENADIKLEVKGKSKDGFWKQVLVNIMSNFLWKVLGILATLGIIIGSLVLFNNH